MVARELAQVFTQTSIPKQVVTDQRVAFMSEVLQVLCCFLGVHPLRTLVYHPKTNGVVEHRSVCWGSLWETVGRIGPSGSLSCYLPYGKYHRPPPGSRLSSCCMGGIPGVFWTS